MPWIITGLIISYLFGSIPTAYIFVRIIKGEDIRLMGSGNVGATNASRVLGKPLGFLILFLDILKGLAAVLIIGNIIIPKSGYANDAMLRMLLGIFAILGHTWTVFLNFKGGKGVATTLGVLLGLSFCLPGLGVILLLSFASWALVFAATRIVSLASVIACILFPVLMLLFRQPLELTAITILISLFIILRHSSNIRRLLQGKEKRLS